jgi:multidrug efflux pump subunit AcrA (membrane-fusion protein)
MDLNAYQACQPDWPSNSPRVTGNEAGRYDPCDSDQRSTICLSKSSLRWLIIGLLLWIDGNVNIEWSLAQTGGEGEPASGWLDFPQCPIFAIDQLDLPAKESGVIDQLPVQINQEVVSGQVLGKLDQSTAILEESLAGKQAQVALALASDESDLRFAELLVEEARIALDSYDRIHARGAASDAEMRSKRLAVTQAELKVQHAIQTQEQLQLKARLAQASVLAASERLTRLQVVAPFAGSIAEVYRHPGEWIQLGQPILRLVRLDELRVDVYLPLDSLDITSLIDAPVTITANRVGMDHVAFAGRITHYDPVVSSTNEVRVHATIQNQRLNGHWLLLPGMTAHMKVSKPGGTSALSLLNRFPERR